MAKSLTIASRGLLHCGSCPALLIAADGLLVCTAAVCTKPSLSIATRGYLEKTLCWPLRISTDGLIYCCPGAEPAALGGGWIDRPEEEDEEILELITIILMSGRLR